MTRSIVERSGVLYLLAWALVLAATPLLMLGETMQGVYYWIRYRLITRPAVSRTIARRMADLSPPSAYNPIQATRGTPRLVKRQLGKLIYSNCVFRHDVMFYGKAATHVFWRFWWSN